MLQLPLDPNRDNSTVYHRHSVALVDLTVAKPVTWVRMSNPDPDHHDHDLDPDWMTVCMGFPFDDQPMQDVDHFVGQMIDFLFVVTIRK